MTVLTLADLVHAAAVVVDERVRGQVYGQRVEHALQCDPLLRQPHCRPGAIPREYHAS